MFLPSTLRLRSTPLRHQHAFIIFKRPSLTSPNSLLQFSQITAIRVSFTMSDPSRPPRRPFGWERDRPSNAAPSRNYRSQRYPPSSQMAPYGYGSQNNPNAFRPPILGQYASSQSGFGLQVPSLSGYQDESPFAQRPLGRPATHNSSAHGPQAPDQHLSPFAALLPGHRYRATLTPSAHRSQFILHHSFFVQKRPTSVRRHPEIGF